MQNQKEQWLKSRNYTKEQLSTARIVLDEIISGEEVMRSIRNHPLKKGGYIAKHALVYIYQNLIKEGKLKRDPALLAKIRMKPIRSLSGVTTVTVLTKPHPCPGECIFCPDDDELPKSYLKLEPGAARAFENKFDPFQQVASRIASYQAIGHPTSKIELLILGGSWTAYPADYQVWFVQRCLDAMNGFNSSSLKEAQSKNESSEHRNVGLVIETRPDEVTPEMLRFLRSLGVTKVQIGAQSFDDEILRLNKRGHSTQVTLDALALLRAGGFKIVLHWMPNLLGSSVEKDRKDFSRMWKDGYCPDELKIYPTQLVEKSELYKYWQKGEYQPYTTDELIHLIADLKPGIPEYCRVNRIIRDIPAPYIVAGNKRSSLRQDVQKEVHKRGDRCRCIRCREIRGKSVDPEILQVNDFIYQTKYTTEHFLNYSTNDDRLAGYLRLSFPDVQNEKAQKMYRQLYRVIPELENCAVIREVHIYGQALKFGVDKDGAAQHSGLGTRLIDLAVEKTKSAGVDRLAVISAIGTRLYYLKRGFSRGQYYMIKEI